MSGTAGGGSQPKQAVVPPTSNLLGGKTRREVWSGPLIDADVHVGVPSLQALFPYLGGQWVEFILERGFVGPPSGLQCYPPNAPSSARDEWRPDGQPPASDLALLREHVLDPWEVDYAILTCNFGIESVRHPDFSNALSSAVNDWVVDEWLSKEPRLRASLVVPPRRPADMVKEIERVGDHPGFVSAYMPVRTDRLYGNRNWHPVFEALTARDLVMNLHWGGTTDGPPSPTGWPSWYLEEYAAEQQVYMAQLTSMVAEGLFSAFPSLRVAVAEIGFAWLPSLWWRLEKEWKGLRREIPWVNQPVTDVIRQHMRFTVAPLDAGPPEEMARIVEWLRSEDLLMFATDYPHRHDDDMTVLFNVVPDSMLPKLMAESAREWYRLDG